MTREYYENTGMAPREQEKNEWNDWQNAKMGTRITRDVLKNRAAAWDAALRTVNAAYEDTGLTPGEVRSLWGEWDAMMRVLNSIGGYDRFRELAEADKERCVVILPCRVGRRVYVPDFEAQTVANVRVQGISITPTGRVVLHFGGYPSESAWGDRGGMDWFLTHEGAEAALRRADNG